MDRLNLPVVCVLLMLLAGLTCPAQPTLTQSGNQCVIGQVDVTFRCDSVTVIPKATGPAQIWDFSNVVNLTPASSLEVLAPSAVPSASAFPSPSFLYGESELYTACVTTQSPDKYEVIGNGGGSSASTYTLLYSDAKLVMTWPFTYQTVATDTYSFNGNPFSNSGTVTLTGTGYGDILLPQSVAIGNVLQITQDEIYLMTNTVSAKTQTVQYKIYQYWSPLWKAPAVVVTYKRTFPVVGPSFLNCFIDMNVPVGTFISENQSQELRFLNPLLDNLTISDSCKRVIVTSLMGIIIYDGGPGTVSTSGWPSGLYIINVDGKSKKVVKL